ncbi:MAG: hypothetical protein IPQ09_30470 [Myxococcales bacterium]|nr:hypothetical protein [Myxococcales bacterium]
MTLAGPLVRASARVAASTATAAPTAASVDGKASRVGTSAEARVSARAKVASWRGLSPEGSPAIGRGRVPRTTSTIDTSAATQVAGCRSAGRAERGHRGVARPRR